LFLRRKSHIASSGRRGGCRLGVSKKKRIVSQEKSHLLRCRGKKKGRAVIPIGLGSQLPLPRKKKKRRLLTRNGEKRSLRDLWSERGGSAALEEIAKGGGVFMAAIKRIKSVSYGKKKKGARHKVASWELAARELRRRLRWKKKNEQIGGSFLSCFSPGLGEELLGCYRASKKRKNPCSSPRAARKKRENATKKTREKASLSHRQGGKQDFPAVRIGRRTVPLESIGGTVAGGIELRLQKKKKKKTSCVSREKGNFST